MRKKISTTLAGIIAGTGCILAATTLPAHLQKKKTYEAAELSITTTDHEEETHLAKYLAQHYLQQPEVYQELVFTTLTRLAEKRTGQRFCFQISQNHICTALEHRAVWHQDRAALFNYIAHRTRFDDHDDGHYYGCNIAGIFFLSSITSPFTYEEKTILTDLYTQIRTDLSQLSLKELYDEQYDLPPSTFRIYRAAYLGHIIQDPHLEELLQSIQPPLELDSVLERQQNITSNDRQWRSSLEPYKRHCRDCSK